jgi:hypothetical protein
MGDQQPRGCNKWTQKYTGRNGRNNMRSGDEITNWTGLGTVLKRAVWPSGLTCMESMKAVIFISRIT